MKLSALLSAAVLLCAPVGAAYATPVGYPNPGTVAPVQMYTATATGTVQGYFAGYSAGDTDEIRMVDQTSGYTSAYFFVNNSTAIGTQADFGSVQAGDVLSFEILNETTNQIFSSNPADSADGLNHAYGMAFGGGTLNGYTYAAGNYTGIGMEDLPKGRSDFDYNDDWFLFSNVDASPTPEPSSLLLLGTGLFCMCAVYKFRYALVS